MSAQPLRVMMVDDEVLILEGLKMFLDFDERFEVVETADGAEAALTKIEAGLQVDLVVTDLRMPGLDGIDLTRLLKQIAPTLPVLVLSSSDETLHAHDALRAGASGYLMKRSAPDDLVDALLHIAGGGLQLSNVMWDRLCPTETLPEPVDNDHRALLEVLAGMPCPAVHQARQLGWPLRDYEERLRRLTQHLGLQDPLQVVLSLHRPADS